LLVSPFLYKIIQTASVMAILWEGNAPGIVQIFLDGRGHPEEWNPTWLGHSTFLFRSPGGKRLLIEPWVASNPACPESSKKIDRLDLILITHGHSDHTGDAVSIARATGAHVIANYEVCLWLEAKGIQNTAPMGQGGTHRIGDIAITMVNAVHGSSVVEDGRVLYLGQAAGFVIRFEDGLTIYFAGDTDVFGDMRLIGEMYRPTIAFLPIGDRFTMGPACAARAAEMLGVKQVVPMHYGTFPFLTGTPEEFRVLVENKGIQVLVLKPGETAS
jgi:L-ascorbate metabolism protein UlaG (beta-lactamase superfamily)